MTTIPDSLSALKVPTGSLKHYGNNPRRGNVDAIAASLAANGQYRPVVVNSRTGEVLAGNHTLKAARQLGWSDIAATFVDADDVQAARIVLVDNKTNDDAEYDNELLTAMLQDLPDLDGTGYDQAELEALLATIIEVPAVIDNPDSIPEPPTVPVTVRGDVWKLGPHRVICGDCRDFADVETLIGDAKINVAFTSPPYASQRTYDQSSGFEPIKPDDYVDWFADVSANVRSVLADNGSWFVNIKEHANEGQRVLYVKDLTIAHVRRWGWLFVDELAWVHSGLPGTWDNRHKNQFEPVFHYSASRYIKFHPAVNGTVSEDAFLYQGKLEAASTGNPISWSGSSVESKTGVALPGNVLPIGKSHLAIQHEAMFPVGLPSWFIRAYSDPGDNVYDPFIGSGTTLIAAQVEGRVAFGVEISPRYVDVTCSRYQEATGTLPVLESTGQVHDFNG